MICEICNKEFELIRRRGGNNRITCYECIPDGLTRNERNTMRNLLLTKKSRSHKESLGCQKCGYNKFGGAMDWHHESDDKEHNPSNALSISWTAYLVETEKCVLLCSNCHREVHAGVE